MIRLVLLVLVCVLGFMLSGLPRVLAGEDCARSCLEHEGPDEEGCESCLCARGMWSAPPPEHVLPAPPPASMAFALMREGAPRDGAPPEVFRPPRRA